MPLTLTTELINHAISVASEPRPDDPVIGSRWDFARGLAELDIENTALRSALEVANGKLDEISDLVREHSLNIVDANEFFREVNRIVERLSDSCFDSAATRVAPQPAPDSDALSAKGHKPFAINPGEGWRLLSEGEPLLPGDGYIHPSHPDFWSDYECRPDIFRGNTLSGEWHCPVSDYAHTWPWRRRIVPISPL